MMAAAEIAKRLGGARAGSGWTCRCPVPTHGQGRGDRNPSLSICDGDGDGAKLLVHCHAGCDFRDVLDILRRRGLLEDRAPARRVSPARRCEPVAEPVEPESIEPDESALALWRSAQPMFGTKAASYLRTRAVAIDPPPSLRFTPDAEYIGGRIYLPAMIAAVQAGDRRIIAAQITFLDPRGDRKTQLSMKRKTIGKLHDGAVRLGPAGEALGIAEGVETALAAMQLSGVPCWACLGSNHMSKVVVPDTVKELHVFADNDEPGRLAAEQTANAHALRRVVVHFPPDGFNDFADVAADLAKHEAAA